MVGQQLSMQEMQLLQEFHIPHGQTDGAHAILRPALVLIAALIWLVSACSPGTQSQRLDSRTLSQATSLLDEIARAELALSPETATRLGLDDVAGDKTLSRLDDHSQAGFERKRLIRLDLLALVRSRPLLPEGHPVGRDLQIVDDALTRLTIVQVIGHGQHSLGSTRPYAIDPFSGIWIDGPSLLVNDHRVETRDDVIAYLTRLQAFARCDR